MSEQSENKNKLSLSNNNEMGFLYKKLKGFVTPALLEYWLSIPEFYDEIIRIKGTDTKIDADLVFQIMRDIYNEKLNDSAAGVQVDFRFSQARRCLRVLSEKLTGSRDNWDK